MNMYKAVIFDMDGVLVDSQPFHFEADMITLQKCGFPAAIGDVKTYAGMASADRWAKYIKDYGLKTSVELMIKTHEKVKADLLKTTKFKAVSGIKELLEMLKSKRLKLSVASSSSYGFIYLVLDALEIRHYFDVIISGEAIARSKPFPDIFLAAAAEMGFTPEECVVIEDSNNGVMAAFNAGMKCIGYVNITSGEQDLSKASIIIDDFFRIVNDTQWLE